MEKNFKDLAMGFIGHPVTNPSVVIPRKSRWRLTNVEHPNFHWWTKFLKTDYVNKKIYVNVYDDAKGDVFNWIQDLVNTPKSHGNLTLTHLDGVGDAISVVEFSELKLLEHSSEYDYGVSDILTHSLVIGYNKIIRKNEKV